MAVNLKIVSQVVASGTPGPVGKSAYQIAVENGFEGTESEWLKQLLPFKGWYDSVSGLETAHANPIVGDYAYVKGATSSDPVKIYECSTEGSWSDSGRTVDTSGVQTFGSGEDVTDVNITGSVSDIVEDSVKLPTAGAVASALGRAEFSTGEKIKDVGIDDEPTAGSDNLVKSGGVKGLFNSQYSEAGVDFAILDENNNAIVGFDDGHIKTKNFDSSKDATENDRGLMSVTDKQKLNGIETGAEVNNTITNNIASNKYVEDVDILISDEDDNSILCLSDGYIKTKNFDSKESITKKEFEISEEEQYYSDLTLLDGNGNAIISFSDGHIKTKNFDSSNIEVEVDALEQQIEGIETEVDGIDDRVFYLESLPFVNVETLSSNIITRCSEMFAPIGHADVSYIPRKELKILFIGNSVTQDHTGYLPWLFTQLYANDVDFTIGNFYYGGRTIKEYVQDFIKPDDPWKAQLYTVAHNTSVWTGYSDTKTLAEVVSSENWDFISIQAYMQRSDAEDISMTPQLVEWLRNNCPSPFELCYLMPQCFSSSAATRKSTRDAALTIIKDNPVSVLFTPYFCMEEAQKYWQISGVLSPEGDGTHLREGFPVMITGMHIMDVLCRRLGLPSRVLKNHLMMTSAINDTLGNHGGNGTVDDTMATDANYIKVQYCTVQGTKQAEAWYNKAINELITNYN